MSSNAPNQSYRDSLWYTTGNLNHAPDIACALGNMIVAWSHLEQVLVGLFQCLTNLPYSDCATLWYSSPTLDGRIRIIKNLIMNGSFSIQDPEPLFNALDKIRRLGGTRNRYVHHSWATNATGTRTVQFDYLEPPNSQARRKPIKAGEILRHSDSVIQRSEELGLEIRKIFPEAPFDSPASIINPDY